MFFLNASKELTLDNPNYKKAVELYVWGAYELDVGKGDITTRYYIQDRNKLAHANVVAHADGVLAGMQEAEWFLKKQGIQFNHVKKDGQKLKKGDLIMRLRGPIVKLSTIERTLLNLLQRMSGVASITRRLADKLPKHIRLVATRKTLWAHLDKRAVALGGGGTHRLGLDDAVIIKDNHQAVKKPGFEFGFLQLAKRAKKARFIEAEIDSMESLKSWMTVYLKHKSKFRRKNYFIVMLDNFTPDQIKKAVPVLKKEGIFIEASGGITEKNITRYALPGVSAISLSAITMSAPALDISMDLIEPY